MDLDAIDQDALPETVDENPQFCDGRSDTASWVLTGYRSSTTARQRRLHSQNNLTSDPSLDESYHTPHPLHNDIHHSAIKMSDQSPHAPTGNPASSTALSTAPYNSATIQQERHAQTHKLRSLLALDFRSDFTKPRMYMCATLDTRTINGELSDCCNVEWAFGEMDTVLTGNFFERGVMEIRPVHPEGMNVKQNWNWMRKRAGEHVNSWIDGVIPHNIYFYVDADHFRLFYRRSKTATDTPRTPSKGGSNVNLTPSKATLSSRHSRDEQDEGSPGGKKKQAKGSE